MDSHRHISATRQGDVVCVRLKHTRLEETEIAQLGDEILSLCREGGCPKLAMSLGPETPSCLYSVFLARLVATRNALGKLGGQMVLCDVGPNTLRRLRGLPAAQGVRLRARLRRRPGPLPGAGLTQPPHPVGVPPEAERVHLKKPKALAA